MRVTFDSRARRWLMRIATLGAGAALLAGCATGYSLVRPGVAGSGSYYTGSGPYAGPYYAGAYGAALYPDAFGGYGPWYGSSISFSIGFGNAWGWPYYSGFYGGAFGGWPWYTGLGYPVYGYGGYGWHRYHHRSTHTGSHHHDWRDPVASETANRPWLNRDHARVPPHDRTPASMVEAPASAVADLTAHRRLPSASFAPPGAARLRIRQPANAAFAEATPAMPAYIGPAPRQPTFAPRPVGGPQEMAPMARGAGAMPQPSFRTAPMHFSPSAAPVVRSRDAPDPRIR